MYKIFPLFLLLISFSLGCSTAPDTPAERREIVATAQAKLDLLKAENEALYDAYDKTSVAVAVFPKVGKGGLIVGGAYGKGVVFGRDGQTLGYCDVSQGTVGAQIGGQAYTQFIFLKNERALQDLKQNQLAFGAQVSAVAAASDANKTAKYSDGVAVVVMDAKGLMAEASVSGQKFRFIPAKAYEGE